MNKPNKGRLAFTAFLLAFALFMVIASRSYEAKPSFFPLIVGMATIIMTVPVLVDDVRPIPLLRRLDISLMGASAGGSPDERSEQVFSRRVLVLVMWLIGFFMLVLLVGFYIGMAIFTFSFLKTERRGGWFQSALTTAIVVGLVYLIFGVGMRGLFLFEGIFFGEILPSI